MLRVAHFRCRLGTSFAFKQAAGRLARQHPRHRLQDRAQRLDELDYRLRQAVHNRLHAAAQRLQAMSGRLHTLSPLATVQRGYAIARRYPGGEILRRAADIADGRHPGNSAGRGATAG